MKKIEAAQIIQILANVGVIAGIVFLALELQQNNQLLTAQARVERAQMRIDGLTEYMNNRDIIQARLKDVGHAALTPEESIVLGTSWEVLFTRWQYIYGEYQAGLIEKEDIPVAGWRRMMSTYPSMAGKWETVKGESFRPDFVRWMEQEVIHPR